MSDTEETAGGQSEQAKGEPQQKRPNAKYRLSNENASDEQIVYRYNRERRLEKAPQAVRDLYQSGPPKRFRLLGPLVSSKSNIILLFSIVIMCALIMVLSALGYAGDSWELDGSRLAIQAVKYEGAVIVAVKKTTKKNLFGGAAYTGAVNIAVSPAAKSGDAEQPGEVFYHRVFFTLESPEVYRFAIPFDNSELVMVFQTEKKTLSLKIKPE